jgi:hypothetical protein
MVTARIARRTSLQHHVSRAFRMAAIRFLTQTGQRCDDKREEFILLSGQQLRCMHSIKIQLVALTRTPPLPQTFLEFLPSSMPSITAAQRAPPPPQCLVLSTSTTTL